MRSTSERFENDQIAQSDSVLGTTRRLASIGHSRLATSTKNSALKAGNRRLSPQRSRATASSAYRLAMASNAPSTATRQLSGTALVRGKRHPRSQRRRKDIIRQYGCAVQAGSNQPAATTFCRSRDFRSNTAIGSNRCLRHGSFHLVPALENRSCFPRRRPNRRTENSTTTGSGRSSRARPDRADHHRDRRQSRARCRRLRSSKRAGSCVVPYKVSRFKPSGSG